jgi:succinate-semialdehyde dehydrogenase/glutarate-semialdehyde dehydrogenase
MSTVVEYRSIDPSTGVEQHRFEHATDRDVETALDTVASSYPAWSTLLRADRAARVLRFAEGLEQEAESLGRLITQEMGKKLEEAVGEVRFSAHIVRYYAENAETLLADQELPSPQGSTAVVQRLPIGPLLGIMPWNYPAYQVARFVAPNLVLGNTIVLKHAESVPQCALAIERIAHEAGLEGVYVNVLASHEQVARIIADPRVQGVSLTGSERAGAAVARTAGEHLKKCVLELGGSDPYIVLDADDVAAAAAQAWRTRLGNMGQACNSNKRLIVHRSIAEEFVAELTRLASDLRPGDPMALGDDEFGPLSSQRAVDQLREQLSDAVASGARLLAGGTADASQGAYLAPAVLTGVTPEMRAYREEMFGPVAVVYVVDDEDEAVQLANDSLYGLGGAVFSTDEERARRVASRLEVGMANVNTPAGEGAEIPFGGVKRSGFGRELGPLGVDEFANRRVFYVQA